MDSLEVYIPIDRRQALASGQDLPEQTSGAALFADISGFTPLTDALVKELGPRRGVEELIHQLNQVYDALIAEVHLYGGSVIGFVGDAITCWFDRDNGLRATACGLAMQQSMAPFTAIPLPTGGTVSLAIKVGIATGPARRFQVGDPQIQYLDALAGVTLRWMALAEKQAEKGEVLLDQESAARLWDKITIAAWRTDQETGQRFAVVIGLTEPVETTPWPDLSPQALSEAQIQPWLLLPVYKRLKTGQSHFLAELRPAAALFLKFDGLDYDQEEAAGQKLDGYIRWVQRTVKRYEGHLIQLTIGDKGSFLYAAFGAPIAHDDDPARAVAAALDLQKPPEELAFIKAQIGLGWGQMRTGAYGSCTRQNYGVIGDEAILAARLMTIAKPGQILVDPRVAEAVVDKFRLPFIGPVPVKGKKEPVPVSMVAGPRLPSLPGLANRFVNPLVGRDDELAQLQQILTVVLNGQEQIVWLEGAAGVGKSHLVAEFAQRAVVHGVRVALGTCQSTSQDVAYHPWRQIFRALIALTDEPPAPLISHQLVPEETAAEPGRATLGHDGLTTGQIAQIKGIVNHVKPDQLIRLPLLGDLLGLPIADNPTTAALDPRSRREALIALAVELLQSWAQDRPLLLLIEDAHWLDEASLGLILALSRTILNVPLLLIVVQRPATAGEEKRGPRPDLNQLPYSHHLKLGELSAQGLAALVSHRLQGEPSALALSLIQTQAQGNAFYAEELVDVLQETGGLYRQADGRWVLSEAIFKALREANCLARADGQWLLADQAPLAGAGLGLPDSIHGLVLSRLDRLPEGHKVTLKAASVIGPSFEFDLLLHTHPGQPGPAALLEQIAMLEEGDFLRPEPPPGLTYSFKHNITQEVTYETLLESQQRELHQAIGVALEDLHPEAIERLAYHYTRSGVRDKTLFYLDKAARKTQREYANETALNYYRQALLLEERWEWRQGQVEVLHLLGRREEEEASLRQLEANPDVPAFEVAYLRGQYYEAIGDYPQSQTAVERALQACRDTGDLVGEIGCLTQLGLIARRRGDYESAKAWYDQGLALFEAEGTYPDGGMQALGRALDGLGTVHRQRGDFAQAQTCYKKALALSHMTGDHRSEAEALNNLGVTAFYQRNFAEAMTYLRQALEIRQSIGDQAGEGGSLFDLAIAIHEAGDYGQAQRYYSKALALQRATGNRFEEVNIWNSIGILYQELGDLAAAEIYFQRGLKLAQEISDEAGQAYLKCNMGLVVRDRGDLAAAEQLLSDGLTLFQKENNKYEMSFFLSYLSTVSLRAGRLEEAVERAKTALMLRQELDMRLNTTDDLATLAAAQLAAGDVAEALANVEQVLAILEECGGKGPEFPQRDYFIGYKVLAAAGQEERAQAALQAAYSLVMARAEKITDPALRQSFLEKVAINREIVAEAARVLGDSQGAQGQGSRGAFIT